MKMKTVTGMILSLAMASSVLAACSSNAPGQSAATPSNDKKEEKIELTMWHSFTQGGRKDFMDKAAADFAAQNPGVTIKMEVFPWADFYTKWTTGLASGQVPDISTALPTHVAEMVDADAIVSLNDVIDNMGRNRFYPAPIAEFTKDGKNYGIPIYAHAHVMWYRKDLLEKAGVQVPKTWAQLLEAAKKVNAAPDVYGLAMPMGKGDYLSTLFLNLYVKSAGETLLTKDGKANLTSKAALDGIKYWVDVYKSVSPESSINNKTGEQSTLFYKGKTAFDFNSGFHIGGIETNSPQLLDSISAAPVPKVNENDPNHGIVTSNIPVVVWKKTKHQEMSKKFIKFMMDKERYVSFLHSVPGGMLPVLSDIADSPEFMNNATIKKFNKEVNIIKTAVAKGTGIGLEHGPKVEASILTNQSVIEEMFQSIVLQNVAIDKAAKAAEDKLNSLMP